MASRRRGNSANPFDERREEMTIEDADELLFGNMDPTIALDNLRLDGGTQPREELDQDTIDEYTNDMQRGDRFPPVTVFYDGESYWLADGFHRVHAARQAGLEKVRAEIRQGTLRDAVLFSLGVNASHGKRRTNADKRRAVMRMLEDKDWSQWSDNEIARHCKVSQPFVSKLRKLSYNGYKMDGDPGEPETRKVRRGDTVYEQRVSADKRQEVAKRRAQDAQEPPASAESEPVGQFEDAPSDGKLDDLRWRIIAALIEWGELSPNKLRQAARADYAAYNAAVSELLASGAIEQVKDVQSGRVVYRVPAETEQSGDQIRHGDGFEQVRADHRPVQPREVSYTTPVLDVLQDFIGLALDLRIKLGDIHAGWLRLDEGELQSGFVELVAQALDVLEGHEDERGEWVMGLVDELEHFREDLQ